MPTRVIGNGPFEFTGSDGTQVSIPLSALDINSSGVLEVNSAKWTPWTSYDPDTKALISNLLLDLHQRGLIVAAPAPSPKPALIVSASAAGAFGNNIMLTVAVTTASSDPGNVVFAFTVTETELFTGLGVTPDTTTTALAQSNLVKLDKAVDTTLFPVDGTNVLSNAPATAGDPPLPNARVDIKDKTVATKIVFGLAAKKAGNDGNGTNVAIKGKTATTFDLTVTWQKVFSGLTLGTLPATDLSSADIKVSPPPLGGGIFSVPAAGTVSLMGGADAPSATASAVVFSA